MCNLYLVSKKSSIRGKIAQDLGEERKGLLGIIWNAGCSPVF